MKRLMLILTLLTAAVAARGESVWIEGEKPARSTFIRHNWHHGVQKDMLSGREWHSHYHPSKAGEATYAFRVKDAGTFAVWVRCNPFRTAMSWRLDDGKWADIDLGKARERVMTSKTPDHRFIAWVKAGEAKLSAGSNTVSFRISKGDMAVVHGGIDCLVLTSDGFVPTGAVKPGELAGPAGPEDWFVVAPGEDPFSEKSLTDMSGLRRRPAGKLGFLKRDGDRLRFEKADAPVKFWGCGANCAPDLSDAERKRRVHYLARLGVNMVRQHSVFGLLGHRSSPGYAKRLDAFDRWFADLKAAGIYMTWSVFYPLEIAADDGYPAELFAELPAGRDGLRKTGGVVNLSPQLQDLQWEYLRALLDHTNPYTGLAYRDEPALAVVEVHNEDCIFWHYPLNELANPKGELPRHAALLRRRFRDWAKARYKTDAALQAAWGTRESFSDKEFRIYGAWQMKGEKPNRRMGDFTRFLTELQRGFYERRQKRLREAGFRGVTVSTAWRAGGPAADAANLYCDTAMDMIDRHNYFGGGEGRHRILPGKVNAASHLHTPGGGLLAVGMHHVEGRPFSVTEWTQCPPNQYKAEAAPLVAFYGMGLQGWDASYHFLNSRIGLGSGWPGLGYYVTDTPHYAGQFSALAFALAKGHIAEGPVVAARRLEPEDCFRGIDPLQQDFTGGGQDAKELKGDLRTPADVLAMGRVTVRFDGGESRGADWASYRDVTAGVVRSATGQLAWDYKRGVVTLSGPKTHAIVGFAGGRTFDLPGVKVRVDTEFVSLIFTPLDDKPLAQSRSILITAMARDRQSGAKYSADGQRLLEIGRPPLEMEPVRATISLAGDAPKRVDVLDVHGVPTGRAVKLDGGSFRIDGTHRTYYYHVNR